METRDTNTQIFNQTECLLAPGELVQYSGIYEICHHDEPRSTVIFIRNTIFPYCRQCGDLVRYKVLDWCRTSLKILTFRKTRRTRTTHRTR
jgi:hypothetical protein